MQKKIKQAKKYLEWGKPNQAISELKPTLNSDKIQKEFKWVPNHLMGIALSLQGEIESAIRYLEKAVRHGSQQAETYYLLSQSYFKLEKFKEAEEYGEKTVALKDDFLKAWMNLGKVYQSQAKLNEALRCYKEANRIDPKNADVAYNIGKIYRDQGDLDQAMNMFDVTLQVDEDHLEAMLERADLLKDNGKLEEALEKLTEASEDHHNHPAIVVSEAEVSRAQGDYDYSIELYEKILEDYPQNGPLLINYALCLQEVGRFKESEKYYREAIALMDDSRNAISNYLMGLHYNPENSREYIFKEHTKYCKEFIPEGGVREHAEVDVDPDKKLKVGFISSGFRRHPVGWMIVGALEQLPDDDFELVCYTTDNRFDFITRRIHRNIDQWKSIIGYSDEVIKNIILDDNLDILVDLTGHAADNCMNVMAHKPTSVLVKWVGGLFNTTGLEAFDYLISDWHETPQGEEQYYTEKLVRLPDDYISFTPPAYAPDVKDLPAEDNGYITFGCFNNPTKVNEEVLQKWAHIMRQVPESRLYLKSKQYDTASFRKQILEVMEGEGIAKERIEFEGRTGHEEHLDAYNKIDIALDPWPYSGGLTTCEAIYMGVPVITMPGPTFAGRHSTTHLMNAGLQEFVTGSWEAYTEKAVALANDKERLQQMRDTLRDQLLHSPVCDSKRFGAHLSVAFREIWKQRVEGHQKNEEEWQDHITVEALPDEEVQELTDGPDTTPLITIKDTESDKVHDQAKDKDFQNNTVEESMIDTEALAQDAVQNGNGQPKENGTTKVHSQSPDSGDEHYYIETKDGVTICMPADLDVLTTYVLLEQEEWFEPELNFVRQYLKPGMQVVDVGASFGAYALPMAKKVGSAGNVFAFEPSAQSCSYLERSKIENGIDQLEIIGRGLSDQTSKAAVTQAKTPELNTITEEGDEEVSLTTLNAWWEFAGQPDLDLIKIDVNGMEPRVLKGGAEVMKQTKPVILASIGEKEDSLSVLRDTLGELNYRLFEYISGPGVLADHDSEAGVDPYLMNMIAIPESRVEEFKESGWIFDENAGVEPVDVHEWKNVLGKMPWAESQLKKWKKQVGSKEHHEYLQALSLACVAEQMEVSDEEPKSRTIKGTMLLEAAQKLIGLFNSGSAGVAAAMTYVRVMSQLGKRTQAAEMMKELMETANSGRDISVDLPFLPPLPEQDNTDIKTDFSKWLTVRIVEGWIMLNNLTTYMADEQAQGMLEALEGNPELNGELSKCIRLQNEKGDEVLDIKLNKWFWSASDSNKLSAISTSSDGHSAVQNSLKHLYLGYPGKKGGAHGIHEIRIKKLASEINKKGISTSVFSTSKPSFLEVLYKVKNKSGHACYSGVMGCDLKVQADMGISGNIFDLLDMPVFAFFGDHPYTDFMWNRVVKSAKKTTFLTPVSSLKEEMELIYPDKRVKKIAPLFPLLGFEQEKKKNLPLKERPIDVLIPWGLHKFFNTQQTLEQHLNVVGSEQKKLGIKLYRNTVYRPKTSIFKEFLKLYQLAYGNAFRPESLNGKIFFSWLKVLSLVDWAVRKNRRIKLLKNYIASLPSDLRVVVTADKGVSTLISELDNDHIEWIGETNKVKLNQLYRKSKIVFNCSPTYIDSIHSRIYEGLNCGCFVVTDCNSAIDQIFSGEETIGILDENKEKSLRAYLNEDWSLLEDKIERAKKIVNSRFNAQKHAESIIEVITERGI